MRIDHERIERVPFGRRLWLTVQGHLSRRECIGLVESVPVTKFDAVIVYHAGEPFQWRAKWQDVRRASPRRDGVAYVSMGDIVARNEDFIDGKLHRWDVDRWRPRNVTDTGWLEPGPTVRVRMGAIVARSSADTTDDVVLRHVAAGDLMPWPHDAKPVGTWTWHTTTGEERTGEVEDMLGRWLSGSSGVPIDIVGFDPSRVRLEVAGGVAVISVDRLLMHYYQVVA